MLATLSFKGPVKGPCLSLAVKVGANEPRRSLNKREPMIESAIDGRGYQGTLVAAHATCEGRHRGQSNEEETTFGRR